jgi:hypothetical protein
MGENFLKMNSRSNPISGESLWLRRLDGDGKSRIMNTGEECAMKMVYNLKEDRNK